MVKVHGPQYDIESTMADLSKVFQSSTPAEQERLLNGPALDPPEGIIPVFNDPPNQSDMARIIFSICIALTSILVFLRIYAVWFVTKKVHLADCESRLNLNQLQYD